MASQLHAEIISYTSRGEEVCASAARISTTAGNASEIFTAALDNPRNRALIAKVLRSGHKSLIEHAVFTLAMRDVSVFAEQFLIECRLASFTVKSRRYVDFGSFGYHVPAELEGSELAQYRAYMDGLFRAYQEMLDAGVPKEDARFLLPYSFRSNFYCTVNARELGHILDEIRCGRGRGVPELQSIADEITGQLEEMFPCLLPELAPPRREDVPSPVRAGPEPVLVPRREAGAVTLLGTPADPMAMLAAACRASDPLSDAPPDLDALLRSGRPRELEQLVYTFQITGMSLAGITHLARHRMQSVIIPSIETLDHSRFIVPDTIAADPALLERYRQVLRSANDAVRRAADRAVLKKYHYYFALSGNLMDVMTTMNARELQTFIRLRACNRAQWEIRGVATDLLRQLRQSFPALFGRYGPGCYLTGSCPEGRMSCGRAEEMREMFGIRN